MAWSHQSLILAEAPADALRLKLLRETLDIRQSTADYRREFNQLSEDMRRQAARNATKQREVERLSSLVEKYDRGQLVAQRLLTGFERLRREREQLTHVPQQVLRSRLRTLNAQMITLDDQLYFFDRDAAEHTYDLSAVTAAAPPSQRERELALLRSTLDQKQAALRDQQQILTELVQKGQQLQGMYQVYKRLLDDGYLFILKKRFRLRDSELIGWDAFKEVADSVRHGGDFIWGELSRLWAAVVGSTYRRGLAIMVFLMAPLAAYWGGKRLHRTVDRYGRETRRRRHYITIGGLKFAQGRVGAASSWSSMLAMLGAIALQAGIWPAYIVLMTLLYGVVVPLSTDADVMVLMRGLQLSAGILWLTLCGRALVRRGGWPQQIWEWPAPFCHLTRQAVTITGLAALGCLIPYWMIMQREHDLLVTTGQQLTARLLFLAFQILFLPLVAVVGRRGSATMRVILSRDQRGRGFLGWYLWPLVYLALLLGLAGIITLDLLGYHYAATYIWRHVCESAAVLFALWLLSMGLYPWVQSMVSSLRHGQTPSPAIPENARRRNDMMASLVLYVPLVVLAVMAILTLWGGSLPWLMALPITSDVLTRAVVIAVVIALAVVIIQVSKSFTEHLVQPVTDALGTQREVGRKLKTMAPLILALIKAGVVFVAALVVLEELGVNTGPVLAGVGILGLAVGFASQSLIKDVINGLFMLIEDSLSVGDIVKLHDNAGMVEKISLRSVTIRDLAGNVYVVPNSTIDTVVNFTKDYSRFLLDVPVAYREDAERVIGLLREIDVEMRRDLDYSWDILEPIEIMGLERFDASAVIIRARLKTRPGRQWRVKREFQLRMKRVFDQRGIEMPLPHRVLSWNTAPNPTVPAAPKETAEDSTSRAYLRALLQHVDLFQTLSGQEREALIGRMKPHNIPAGEVVIQQGEPGNSMYLVGEGLLDVLIAPKSDGEARQVAQLIPRDIFGEIALLSGASRSATVRAASDTRIYEITKADVMRLIANRPEIADQMSQIVVQRQRRFALIAPDAFDEPDINDQLLDKMRRAFHLFWGPEDQPHALNPNGTLDVDADTARLHDELMQQTVLGGVQMAKKGAAAPELEQTYARSLELARDLGESEQSFPALIGFARFHFIRGELDIARAMGDTCLTLAERTENPSFLAQAHAALGYVLFWKGEVVQCRSHLEKGIELAPVNQARDDATIYGLDPMVRCRLHLAWTLWLLGYPDMAMQQLETGCRIANELSHPHTQAMAYFYASTLYVWRREPQTAAELAETGRTLSIEHEFPHWLALTTISQGWALAQRGQAIEGTTQMRQGISMYRNTGARTGMTDRLHWLAESLGQMGETDDALQILAESRTLIEQQGALVSESEYHRLTGDILRLQGANETEIEHQFMRAIDCAHQQQIKMWELRAMLSLSRLRQQQGRFDEIRPLLEALYAGFGEGGSAPDLQDAATLLDK